MDQRAQTPPGWYADPWAPSQTRYWDGGSWTGHVQGPPRTAGSPGKGRARLWWLLAGALGLVSLVVAVGVHAVKRQSAQPVQLGVAAPPTSAQAAALRLGGPPGSLVITPSQARSVLGAMWTLRVNALTARDPSLLQELESGAAERGDAIRVRCRSCALPAPDASYDQVQLFVPRQTTYPARFLAEVATRGKDGTPQTEILVLVRTSDSSPWTLDLETGWVGTGSGTGFIRARADDEGFNLPVSTATQHVAAAVRQDLADYWQRAKDDGEAPPLGSFGAGSWTTDRARHLSSYPQDGVGSNGLLGHFTASVSSEDPIHEFTYAGGPGYPGGELACGALWTTSIDRAAPGRGDPYQPADRSNWGPQLPPGVYSEITTRYQWQTCFFIPTSLTGIRVLGGYGLTEAVSTGKPRS